MENIGDFKDWGKMMSLFVLPVFSTCLMISYAKKKVATKALLNISWLYSLITERLFWKLIYVGKSLFRFSVLTNFQILACSR